MIEYIERGAAKDQFNDIPPFIGMTGKCVQDMLDKVPSADVAPVVPELRKAVELLHKEYGRAKKNPVVRNPVAYALYQTWKAADNCEKGR